MDIAQSLFCGKDTLLANRLAENLVSNHHIAAAYEAPAIGVGLRCLASHNSPMRCFLCLLVALSSSLLDLDASTLSKQLQEGNLTAVELMESTLDRLEKRNPRLNAIIHLRDREELLTEAAQVDASPRRGWLHGIPMAIKDLCQVQGLPTTMGGSPLYSDYIADRSDPFVTRLQAAGAIIIGKTNTPESGLGSHTYNQRFGATCNPYHPVKSAGGSSGGAAVAVSGRLLPIADGTDMMGSLRNPAGWNNIYSIRPTAGLLEWTPSHRMPLPYPISTPGALARTVHDLALLISTMIGDLWKTPSLVDDGQTYRLAWLGDWNGALPVEDGILDVCESALEVLREANVEITSVENPIYGFAPLWQSWTTIRHAAVSDDALAEFDRDLLLGDSAKVRKELQWEIQQGLEVDDSKLEEASNTAKALSLALARVFEQYDVLALPSAQMWPIDIGIDYPKSINGQSMRTYHEWMSIMVLGSLAGLPALTVPAGFGSQELPIGIQLLTKRDGDATLFQIAQRYHEITDWPNRRPPVFRT